MKTILRIAKAELLTLFYSPIAWFLIIVFLIQCGVVYVGQLEANARSQEMSGSVPTYFGYLTETIFVAPGGLFNTVMQNLYLYIPLLTMSLISRETSSGTIKLLYSSPIDIREIVLGKFAAMMAYSLVLVGVIAIFIISGMFHIDHPDRGMLMTAMLGFYLLLCTYSAIGLFMSCLTTYQVVAAVSTFVMIGILSFVGSLWQNVAFIRELTYFLSINGRTRNLLGGLVTTKDVIYFLVIIYMFLALSIYKLRDGMESKPALIRAGRYLSVIATGLFIGCISSIPSLIGYYDATANHLRTLTPNAQHIIKQLGDEPLEVTVYNNLLSKFWFLGGPESYKENQSRWEYYQRFKHNIDLDMVVYYDNPLNENYVLPSYPGKTMKQVAELLAKGRKLKLKDFKTPEQMRKLIDLRPEMNQYVMQLKWRGRKTFLRVFDDQAIWPSETEVAAAIKRLLQAKLPRIGFLTGQLERDVNKMGDKDYKALTNLSTFRNSLINQGFDVDSVDLEGKEVSHDISTLVIADPKVPFAPAVLIKLEKYVDDGGNLLIATEPGKQDILNPLLAKIGVQINQGIIVQESEQFSPDMVTAKLTDFAGTFYKPLIKSVADSIKVSMPSVTGLTYSTNGMFKVEPLLLTDAKKSWTKKTKLDLELFNKASASVITGNVTGSINAPKPPVLGTLLFSANDGDVRGVVPTAIALTRKIHGKEQHIVVTGDADFLSNSELGRRNMRTSNFLFSTGLFSWLSNKQFPIDTSRPDSMDKKIKVTTDQVDVLRIIYLWVLPGILLLFSIILLVRRKRK
ncbi:ABC transporter permease subunit [Mucilaginibacter corticis]|uniref:ABC transporter permease subunit n=1 Tax=Mucilaginibacter corticis TaxID=2597670 RepID=A0A556MX34_9SPHI|nr:Gldg family protein [Mucilaginibacter corticis]TSJ44481.1 ABC transporter permease subunit [Mucilaginibacter corticis]